MRTVELPILVRLAEIEPMHVDDLEVAATS